MRDHSIIGSVYRGTWNCRSHITYQPIQSRSQSFSSLVQTYIVLINQFNHHSGNIPISLKFQNRIQGSLQILDVQTGIYSGACKVHYMADDGRVLCAVGMQCKC